MPTKVTQKQTSERNVGMQPWQQKMDKARAIKYVVLEHDFAGTKAGTRLLVGTPQLVDGYIKKIRPGRFQTVMSMRRDLARKHDCAAMCPVSTAIFIRMVAEAAWESFRAGADISTITPFWRVIEPNSPIAKKLSVDGEWLRAQRAAEAE